MIKNLLIVLVFALTCQMSFAQDEAFRKDVMKLLETSGANAQMEAAKVQIVKMIPAEKQAAFVGEFTATMPAFYEKLAKIYMEVYTPKDVKEMLAFFETPIGKKMASKAGELFEKSQIAGQEWGVSLQPILAKYMN